MKKTYLKSLLSLIIPFAILAIGYTVLIKVNTLSPLILTLIPYVPYLLLIIVLILAYWFNRSNIFFPAIIFMLIQFCLEAIVNLKFYYGFKLDLLYSLISILLPINILVFGLLKERGITSLWGFLKFALVVGQLLLIMWILSYENPVVMRIISYKVLNSFNLVNLSNISQLSILIFIFSIVILLVRLTYSKNFYNSTAVGLLSSYAFLVYLRNTPLSASIFMTAASIIMIIYILQNSYSMAYLDELTEIPGRRALREEMLKLSGTYSIAMVDIDYFKKFNDKYGHDVGDDVLRLVASKIKLVSGGGRAFRYGGEEFAIVFPGKTLEEMLPHLEILRDTISQAKFTPRDKSRPKKKPERITKSNSTAKKLSVTVSIGAAEKNTSIKTAQDVLTAADKALYRAKKNGRNRVSK